MDPSLLIQLLRAGFRGLCGCRNRRFYRFRRLSQAGLQGIFLGDFIQEGIIPRVVIQIQGMQCAQLHPHCAPEAIPILQIDHQNRFFQLLRVVQLLAAVIGSSEAAGNKSHHAAAVFQMIRNHFCPFAARADASLVIPHPEIPLLKSLDDGKHTVLILMGIADKHKGFAAFVGDHTYLPFYSF